MQDSEYLIIYLNKWWDYFCMFFHSFDYKNMSFRSKYLISTKILKYQIKFQNNIQIARVSVRTT